MKLKHTVLKITASILCIILCSMVLSACSSNNVSKSGASIAMVKNSTMSTYGTGFAVGIPGKGVDTIITSYSVIATPNGAAPKTAKVSIDENERNLIANVAFYDVGRNIAVLKLAEKSRVLKPVIFEQTVHFSESVFVKGYAGTGNIMSDFENFNITDIIQYTGNVSTYDELNSIVVYKYTNEFNRAMVGAPAMDRHGNVIGMCAYSLNSMNTYAQYILSSDEICKLLASQEINYMTAEEVTYKTVILAAISAGATLFAVIVALALRALNKKENDPKPKGSYIRCTDGALKGNVYPFNGKLVIGRDTTKCNVLYPIQEPGISGVHCTIQLEENDCYLVDNFSKFGTFLADGTKIEPSFPYKIEGKTCVFYLAEPQNRFEFCR